AIAAGAPQSDSVIATSTNHAGGVGSIMFALEPKPFWGAAIYAATTAPFITALILGFAFALFNSKRPLAEKIALTSLYFTLTTVIYYHNAAPYFYVFMMPWVLIACAVPMHWAAQRFGPLMIGVLFFLSGLMTYAQEGPSPIEKQRLLIEAAYATFPEDTAYFDFSRTLAQFPQANNFMTILVIKQLSAEGRSIYVEAMAERPVPLLLRNHSQFDTLFVDPANPPDLPNGQPVFTPEDAHALVDTYIDFWGPFMVAGEVIPEGNIAHDFTIRVPGPYTVKGSGILIKGKRWEAGDVIELDRGHYQVSGPRAGETTLVWGDRLTPPSYPAPRKPHSPTW
ncbi:MAG: hypothetical protein AAFY07_10105, partial [Pseudomonadota bacterium]